MKLVRHRNGMWMRPGAATWHDGWTVREVATEDVYGVRTMRDIPKVIVDIGANIGIFASLAHRRFPQSRIICVEPNPAVISCLQANAGSFATIVQAAIGEEDGKTILRQPCNEEHGRSTSCSTTWDGELLAEVDQIRFDTLLDQCGIEQVDLLKVDCEGAEVFVVPYLDRVRSVRIEWHYDARAKVLNSLRGWTIEKDKPGKDTGIVFASRV